MFQSDDLKSSFHWIKGFNTLRKREKPRFPHFGLVTFVGEQGSGKSLSAHKMIKEFIKEYPFLTVVSNVHLNYCDYIPYKSIDTLRMLDNKDVTGIILFFDEISNQFNSLDSRNLPSEWFEIINMQRKRQLLICGTAPILSRISKAFREQLDTICICKNYGTFQVNNFYRADVDKMCLAQTTEEAIQGLTHVKRWFFFHTLDDYENYNTRERVKVKI